MRASHTIKNGRPRRGSISAICISVIATVLLGIGASPARADDPGDPVEPTSIPAAWVDPGLNSGWNDDGAVVFKTTPTLRTYAVDGDEFAGLPAAARPEYKLHVEIWSDDDPGEVVDSATLDGERADDDPEWPVEAVHADWHVQSGALTDGTKYRVRARTEWPSAPSGSPSNGDWSDWQVLTVIVGPPTPTQVLPADYAIISQPRPTLSAHMEGYDGSRPVSGDFLIQDATTGQQVDEIRSEVADANGDFTVQTHYPLPAGDYQWRVLATDDVSQSDWSDVGTFSQETVPKATTYTAVYPHRGGATAYWVPAQTASNNPILDYTIRATPGNYSAVVGADQTQGSLDLPVGSYHLTVTARNRTGSGPAGPSTAVTVSPSASDPPINVLAVVEDTSATVTWDPPANDGGSPITGYEVWFRDFDTGVLSHPVFSGTELDLTDLNYGTDYLAVIYALNAEGRSSGAAVYFRPTREPDAPRNVIAHLEDGALDVQWDPPEFDGGAEIDTYDVTVSPGGQTMTVPAATQWKNAVHFDDLTNGSNYTFVVTAHNVNGVSDPSAPSASKAPVSGADDSDADGVPDISEERAGSNPLLADSDGDGLSDSVEDFQLAGITSPTSSDTDQDDVSDADEDSDDDGLTNAAEVLRHTAPGKADSDSDGLSDGDEVDGGTDPTDSDTDTDGLDDGAEGDFGFDPLDAHSNGGSALDGDASASQDLTDPSSEDGESVTAIIHGPAAELSGIHVESAPVVDLPGARTPSAVVATRNDDTATSASTTAHVTSVTLPLASSGPVPSPSSLKPVKWNDDTGTWEFVNNNVSISSADRTVSIDSPSLGVRYAVVDLGEWRAHATVCDAAATGHAYLNVQVILDETPPVRDADTTGERFTALRRVLATLSTGDEVNLRTFGATITDYGYGYSLDATVNSGPGVVDSGRMSSRDVVNTELDQLQASDGPFGDDYSWLTAQWPYLIQPTFAEKAIGGLGQPDEFAVDTAGNPYTTGTDHTAPQQCRENVVLLVTDGVTKPSTDPDVTSGYGPGYQPFLDRTDVPVHVLDIGAADDSDAWLQTIATQTGGTYSYVPTMTDVQTWASDVTPPPGPHLTEADKTADDDNDGLSNWIEKHGITVGQKKGPVGIGVSTFFYTNPENADTDGDGIPDGDEVGTPFTAAQLGGWSSDDPISTYNVISDPTRADGDHDGLPDTEEVDSNLDAMDPDLDSDGVNDADEAQNGTYPMLADTDSDGFYDSMEIDHQADGYDPLVFTPLVPAVQWQLDFVKGFLCGDIDPCREDNIAWLAGDILSGVLVFGDVRDFAENLFQQHWGDAGLVAIGFVPVIGDVTGATGKIVRALKHIVNAGGPVFIAAAKMLRDAAKDDAGYLQLMRQVDQADVDKVLSLVNGNEKIAADILNANPIKTLKRMLNSSARVTAKAFSERPIFFEKTGKEAEQYLKRYLGLDENQPQAQILNPHPGPNDSLGMGSRYPDAIENVVVDGVPRKIIHESKVGYTGVIRAAAQISKDKALLNAGEVNDVTWHFFASATTKRIGPSPLVVQMLEDANIPYVIHFP